MRFNSHHEYMGFIIITMLFLRGSDGFRKYFSQEEEGLTNVSNTSATVNALRNSKLECPTQSTITTSQRFSRHFISSLIFTLNERELLKARLCANIRPDKQVSVSICF